MDDIISLHHWTQQQSVDLTQSWVFKKLYHSFSHNLQSSNASICHRALVDKVPQKNWPWLALFLMGSITKQSLTAYIVRPVTSHQQHISKFHSATTVVSSFSCGLSVRSPLLCRASRWTKHIFYFICYDFTDIEHSSASVLIDREKWFTTAGSFFNQGKGCGG